VAAVRRALDRRGGWSVHLFKGDTAALHAELPKVDLLHFAGHADFFEDASLDSALAFDRDGAARLTAGDVLAGDGVPATVVLSACDSARSSTVEAPVGLGLAHAFLLAGGRVAIAAVRQVDDEESSALVRRFYEVWDTTPEDAARALATAQLARRAEDPQADWASFRVLER
jgi:CHAT domain-containing protein